MSAGIPGKRGGHQAAASAPAQGETGKVAFSNVSDVHEMTIKPILVGVVIAINSLME